MMPGKVGCCRALDQPCVRRRHGASSICRLRPDARRGARPYGSFKRPDLAENTLAVCSRYIGIEHDLTDVAARFIVQHRDVDGMAGQHVLQLSEHAPREVAQCQLSRRSSR